MCWDNAVDIFVIQLDKSSMCMIYQDNYLLWNSRFSKIFHFQVMCSWGQHSIFELFYCSVKIFGRLNLLVFRKCPRNMLAILSLSLSFFSPQPLLWLKQKCMILHPPLLVFLCGWTIVFIQLHIAGLFWMGSRYWTLQLPQKPWAVVHGEEWSASTQRWEWPLLVPSTDGIWMRL